MLLVPMVSLILYMAALAAYSRLADMSTDALDLFFRMLGEPGVRDVQMQVQDYCSKFFCDNTSE